ncbi:MAG: MerR family transcriptional regulator [bacterium]
MRIKEAADRLGVHRNTLIQYDKLGLHSAKREPDNNYRNYTEADLTWIRCLREMIQDEGFDRKTLARMLELNDCWTIRNCDPANVKSCRWAQKQEAQD